VTEHPILLLDKRTGKFVPAKLVETINESHLASVEKEWTPILLRRLRELVDQRQPLPENWHWVWRDKVARIRGLLAYRTFAIVCEGQTQGLVQINTAGTCRLPGQVSKPLAYVDYLETAPWNRASMVQQPYFGLVGTVLIRAAIEVSLEEGFRGRIGLHSLPQSEAFYAKACEMTELGIDGTYENLKYFEMTPEQAASFLG
jgi:hypothetical protein